MRVLKDPNKIRLLVNPVRKEILRLISKQPMTETQLAPELRLTKADVGYHLHSLLGSGLITLERTEAEEHGILQKFYSPTASLFIASYEHIPVEMVKNFMDIHMERLMGFLGAFLVLRGRIDISLDTLEELAKEMARRVTKIGQRYENVITDLDREALAIEIYAEALKDLMKDITWKSLFKSKKAMSSRANIK